MWVLMLFKYNVELSGAFTRPVEAGFCRNVLERVVRAHIYFFLPNMSHPQIDAINKNVISILRFRCSCSPTSNKPVIYPYPTHAKSTTIVKRKLLLELLRAFLLLSSKTSSGMGSGMDAPRSLRIVLAIAKACSVNRLFLMEFCKSVVEFSSSLFLRSAVSNIVFALHLRDPNILAFDCCAEHGS